MDYGDVIIDQPRNESLYNRIDQELDLEHLHQRLWMRRLCLFYRVFHRKDPKYIHTLIPSMRTSARDPNTFTSFYCRTKYFQHSFLLYVI